MRGAVLDNRRVKRQPSIGMEPGTLFSQLPVAQLGFGGMAGVCVGYTAKKIAKLAALLLGLLFLLVQLLASYGYISIDWNAVERSAHEVWIDPSGVTLTDRLWAMLTHNLPFGGAFIAGFALGFKLG
jgi:uncharacterized membrane protein (Fun14 family)